MKKWKLLENPSTDLTNNSYPQIISTLLHQIGVLTKEDAEKFLKPNIDNLHDFKHIFDIKNTAKKLLTAIKEKKKIFIHGDYDVDGIVSTSILWDFLYRKLEANVIPIVPNRFTDGYGLSSSTLEKIKAQEGEVVITVDCGIKDIDLIKQNSDISFLITDHHTFDTDDNGDILIPTADNLLGVVHPQDPRGNYPYKNICGAAVTWKLIYALAEQSGLKEFDPFEYIDLVALATTTDVMPLLDENRTIVKFGLEEMKQTKKASVLALLEVSGVEPKDLENYHFGFVIGPRINAAGRMDDAIEAVRLLSTNNPNRAKELATLLDEFNKQRQQITIELMNEAIEQIGDSTDNLLFAYGKDWPDGILGLIAGKLQEKFNKPTLVASINTETKEVVGSGRSPSTFNITTALKQHSQYLERFGGHVQAAGFSLKANKIAEFKNAITEYANTEILPEDLIPILKINAEIDINTVDEQLVEDLQLLAPFGFGNPTPKFMFPNISVADVQFVGKEKNHVKLQIHTNDGKMNCIGFNLAEAFQSVQTGDKIDLVGTPKFNIWNGRRSIQIEIKDFKKL